MNRLAARARPAPRAALLALLMAAVGAAAVAATPEVDASGAAAVAATPKVDPSGAAALGAASSGVDEHGQLRDPALESRFEDVTQQLRCLVCQNESIADSNAELAQDLRRQVREMLVAGKSDADIYRFMTDRYGEFVRFAPPLEPKTLLIWGAPFVMLLIGGAAVYRITRQRAAMPLDE